MKLPEAVPVYGENRVSRLVCYMVIIVFGLRKLLSLSGKPGFLPAACILAIFFILFAAQSILSRRWRYYFHFYVVIQISLVLILGWIPPYEDTWGFLYLPLAIQTRKYYSPVVYYVGVSVLSLIVTVTLMATHGWLIGLGYSGFMVAASYLFIAADEILTHTEAARQESERLLADLQAAHQRLQEYSSQIEEITVAQERDRMTRELHDAISQLLFSITLLAQSTRLLIEKHPSQVPRQLEQLQDLTGRALSQMRALISQWKPG